MSRRSKLDEALARAGELVPMLAQAARSADSSGISSETVAALAEGGMYRLSVPREEGGLGLESIGIAAVLRVLARGCAATAYSLAVSLAGLGRLSELPGAARAEALGQEGNSRFSLALMAQNASVAESADGYVLGGQWRTVGALEHADWIWLVAPDRFSALVSKSEVLHTTRTYLGGLRGAGWSDVSVGNVTVPPTRFLRGGSSRIEETGLWMLGMVLGTAEGAYADYVAATKARMSGIGSKAVARFTQVQARVAESEAEMKTLIGLFDAMSERSAADHGEGATFETKRDMAFIARRSLEAVTRLVRQMGAMGLAEANPVQRRYRDLRTLAAAPELAWEPSMAARGRQILGLAAGEETAEAA